MHGFCVECGVPLVNAEVCEQGHRQLPATTDQQQIEALELPKAPAGRRLWGSGLEFLTYFSIYGLAILANLPSFGFIPVDFIPLTLLLMALVVRDSSSGLFSLGKKISGTRVVDRTTGGHITTRQAFMRNSYYIILTGIALFPFLLVDFGAVFLFKVAILIDVTLIRFSKKGLRIGDRFANTQVVPAKR